MCTNNNVLVFCSNKDKSYENFFNYNDQHPLLLSAEEEERLQDSDGRMGYVCPRNFRSEMKFGDLRYYVVHNADDIKYLYLLISPFNSFMIFPGNILFSK